MENKNIENYASCKSPSHDHHLCYIVSQGFHLSDPDDYHSLVNDPKFECRNCGRVANNNENLCEPKEGNVKV